MKFKKMFNLLFVTAFLISAHSPCFGQSATVNYDPNARGAATFDSKFKAPLFIRPEHSRIHAGKSFERHIDSANAVVSSLNVAFKTAAGTELVHAIFGWGSSDEILFEILQGATWTQGSGTVLNVFNHLLSGGVSGIILENKNQPTFTASGQVMSNVTSVSGGTTFENQYTYNAGLGAAVAAETRSATHEWVLKADTTYVIRSTETDGDCKMSIDFHFYEKVNE